MKKVPDVLGMQLQQAEEILKDEGIACQVVKTAPPPGRRQNETTQVRVIRQTLSEDAVVLLVCDV